MHLAVEACTLVELNPTAAQLAGDVTRRLQLEAAVGGDIAGNLAADDRVLGDDIAVDFSGAPYNHGLSGTDRPLDAALDADGSFSLGVADDLHTDPDDGDVALPSYFTLGF